MKNQKYIFFQSSMIQAILDGRKTQTRRIVKFGNKNITDAQIGFTAFTPKGSFSVRGKHHPSGKFGESFFKIPYSAGEILYVRESWKISGWDWEDGTALYEYKDQAQCWLPAYDPTEDQLWMLNYIEQLENKGIIKFDDDESFSFVKPNPWKPSIHMPKAAARIWLKVKEVRVERLQDICEVDAVAEGVLFDEDTFHTRRYKDYLIGDFPNRFFKHPDGSFKSLWQSINGESSWSLNPWVWVVEFEVLSTTGKPSNLKQ
ncbi:hypothetical protein Oweho_3233 [Owenweeksia hongkongensis DSM 17368]|uniref:ASCH domain-containing protein n=1 Tax=Owenweeksia hongkongensis (strain DSM 17368 / CIP 108786 / JCM 12287 / NRRL B-23963 / UST20020801) TaxID=926562 RepID=G8R3U7_OWEHD|nr:hypothetical protein [Owenweeksia hongkongensis]AEV34184.1 hypothetical protein Oweho_3233 [Owenweeksia hongkongensis DSM 17368]